jgi:hypothetical protein
MEDNKDKRIETETPVTDCFLNELERVFGQQGKQVILYLGLELCEIEGRMLQNIDLAQIFVEF